MVRGIFCLLPSLLPTPISMVPVGLRLQGSSHGLGSAYHHVPHCCCCSGHAFSTPGICPGCLSQKTRSDGTPPSSRRFSSRPTNCLSSPHLAGRPYYERSRTPTPAPHESSRPLTALNAAPIGSTPRPVCCTNHQCNKGVFGGCSYGSTGGCAHHLGQKARDETVAFEEKETTWGHSRMTSWR